MNGKNEGRICMCRDETGGLENMPNRRTRLNRSTELGKCWASMKNSGPWFCLSSQFHDGQQ